MLLRFLHVQFLAARAHPNEARDPLGPRSRSFGRLDAPKNGVAIVTFELREEGFRLRICVESGREIGRYAGGFRRVVSLFPTSVFLGSLDLALARRLHLAVSDERQCFLAIHL